LADQVRSFGLIGHDQKRPWEMVHDAQRGQVLIASAAGYGKLDGALTILDPVSGDMHTYSVLPGQSVMSVCVSGGMAYVAGDNRCMPKCAALFGREPSIAEVGA
jgi:hypothetical protein